MVELDHLQQRKCRTDSLYQARPYRAPSLPTQEITRRPWRTCRRVITCWLPNLCQSSTELQGMSLPTAVRLCVTRSKITIPQVARSFSKAASVKTRQEQAHLQVSRASSPMGRGSKHKLRGLMPIRCEMGNSGGLRPSRTSPKRRSGSTNGKSSQNTPPNKPQQTVATCHRLLDTRSNPKTLALAPNGKLLLVKQTSFPVSTWCTMSTEKGFDETLTGTLVGL